MLRIMTGATPVWDPHFIETLEGSFSAGSTPLIARVGAFFSIFRDLQDLHSFAPLESKWKKPWKNHLVDPTEKAENITDKRNQKYITPNTRLTRFVQQCAANTRLTQKLRLLQRRQSEQHRVANFIKFQQISTCASKWGCNFRRMFRGVLTSDENRQERQKSTKFPEMP